MGPHSSRATALLTVALVTIAGAQPFEPDVTNGEFSCMRNVSEESAKFIKKRLACVIRCTKNFWRGKVPESDCVFPYGGTTLECLTKFRGPVQGFVEAIGCSPSSCPECYENGDCSELGEGATRPEELGEFADAFVPGIFCAPAAATRPHQSCERKTAKEFVKMFADVQYCADLCLLRARRGQTPYSECTSYPDSEIGHCLTARHTARITRIDRACAEAIADPAFCEGEYPAGAAWANLTSIAFVPYFAIDVYCGS